MAYKFFDKKCSESCVATVPNYQLGNKFQRHIIRKFSCHAIIEQIKQRNWIFTM